MNKTSYEKEGLKVINSDDSHMSVKPTYGDYPYYSFGSKDGKTYYVGMATYEMNRNLSTLEEEHFNMLLSIAERLDRIGSSIKQSLKSGM